MEVNLANICDQAVSHVGKGMRVVEEVQLENPAESVNMQKVKRLIDVWHVHKGNITKNRFKRFARLALRGLSTTRPTLPQYL
jgi:hypothetical protein